MTQIYTLKQIKEGLGQLDLTSPIEQGFMAYSRGEVVVPPVGELLFTDPPGDTHIKYGYIKGQDSYVIKIASGFYENPAIGLSSSSGLMLVFSQKTGFLRAILLDEGYLTDLRTAIAGQIAARYLAPKEVTAIGVLGTGIQARMQVQYLKDVTPCRQLFVWGRNDGHVKAYIDDMTELGFEVVASKSPAELCRSCNLIVTTTPSTTPLIFAGDIQPNTHITAMGSDTSEKQELDGALVAAADLVVADSIEQCRSRGEISKALAEATIPRKRIVELGDVIANPSLARREGQGISVADLTGVAVQDVQIASTLCRALEATPGSNP